VRTGKIGGRAVSKPRAQRRAGSMAGWDIFMSPVVCVCRVATVDHEPDEPARVGERSRTEGGDGFVTAQTDALLHAPSMHDPEDDAYGDTWFDAAWVPLATLSRCLRIPDCCSGTKHRSCQISPYGRVFPLENAESMISRRTGFGVAGSPSVGKVIPQIWVISVLKRIELPFSGCSAAPHASGRG